MSGKWRRMIRLVWPQYLVEPPDVEGTAAENLTFYYDPLVSRRRVKSLDGDLDNISLSSCLCTTSFYETRGAGESKTSR